MNKSTKIRQRVHRGVIIFMFLLFPHHYELFIPLRHHRWGFEGYSKWQPFRICGIVRIFFICRPIMVQLGLPGWGLGEIAFLVNNNPVQGRKIDWIKWLIWVPWISLIVWLVISSGGYHSDQLFPGYGQWNFRGR